MSAVNPPRIQSLLARADWKTEGAVNSLCEPDMKDQIKIAGWRDYYYYYYEKKMALEIEQKNKLSSHYFHS